MKNKNIYKVVLLINSVFFVNFTAVSSTLPKGGASEFTQILNNVELVNQTKHEILQIKNQLRDLASVTNRGLFSDKEQAKEALLKLYELYNKGQSIARSEANIADYYKNNGNISLSDNIKDQNYPVLFNQWSNQNHDTVKSILEQNHMQMHWFKDQQNALETVNTMLNNSTGQVYTKNKIL